MPIVPEAQSNSPSYDEAVLLACQRQNVPPAKKRKTLGRARDLKVSPYWIIDSHGQVQASLANIEVVKALQKTGVNSAVFVPDPESSGFGRSESLSIEKVAGPGQPELDSMLALSPFSKILSRRRFVPLNREYCDFLNEDWGIRPGFRYACAQILAGCILLNTRNGQAILVNTIEVYGRMRSTDIHRESAKNGTVDSSLPNPTRCYYNRVMPVTMGIGAGYEKPKLIIGTNMFDGLITCSTRLDACFLGEKGRHSIGPSNNTFVVKSDEDCQAVRIFLDLDSVTDAYATANDHNAYRTAVGSSIHQLRQLKTSFHDPSTYYMCRAWGPLTSAHVCQPLTVFTLFQNDSVTRGTGYELGRLFYAISSQVLSEGREAKLQRETIENCLKGFKSKGDAAKELEKIFGYFESDSLQEISILGNKVLNESLQVLAVQMSTYVSSANDSVAHFLKVHLKENV
ncbi:hypothetical protein BGZ46_001413 [Entomortierella lignicola]|nr:hypothetical protein BGZ46_001413 [Entomortierella lignicola]